MAYYYENQVCLHVRKSALHTRKFHFYYGLIRFFRQQNRRNLTIKGMIIVYIYQISDNRFILIEYSHQYPLEVKIIREKSIYLHCLGERASIQ